MVLVLSVVGLLFSQALAMLSVFFASEVMPTVLRLVCVHYHLIELLQLLTLTLL